MPLACGLIFLHRNDGLVSPAHAIPIPTRNVSRPCRKKTKNCRCGSVSQFARLHLEMLSGLAMLVCLANHFGVAHPPMFGTAYTGRYHSQWTCHFFHQKTYTCFTSCYYGLFQDLDPLAAMLSIPELCIPKAQLQEEKDKRAAEQQRLKAPL